MYSLVLIFLAGLLGGRGAEGGLVNKLSQVLTFEVVLVGCCILEVNSKFVFG